MVALASLGEGESSMPDSICESDRWLISFSSLMIIYGKSLFHCSEVSRLGMEMEENGNGGEWRLEDGNGGYYKAEMWPSAEELKDPR